MDVNLKASILIAGGSQETLNAMRSWLESRYRLLLAGTGAEAIALAQATPPDLILLDASLPDMDSFTVFRQFQCNVATAALPVIFLTASPHEEQRALQDGAADVLGKPLAAGTVLARVNTQLELKTARAMLRERKAHFAHLLEERTREAAQMQDATIIAMASLAESRDQDTGNHIRRTQHYVATLARELRFHDRHARELTDEHIALLFKAAPLHDIGKVGVADAILQKPGKLTAAEFEQMKLHTVYGRDAIAGVEKTLGATNQFLRYASEITYSHHEYWDGSGYPQGLAGEAIPLSARVMAVADVYDALISARPYRPAFTHETAVELIRQGSGEHFDPDVVDAMLAVEEKFMAIAGQFQSHRQ